MNCRSKYPRQILISNRDGSLFGRFSRRSVMSKAATAYSSSALKPEDRALAGIFAAYTVSAAAWLIFATFVGILLAFKFGAPEFGSGAWLTFGRLRPIHTNATFYGWASVALVGLAYYVAVRSGRTSLYSVRLAW